MLRAPVIYLTPLIPLSFKGEGEMALEEGAKPPLRLPLPFILQGRGGTVM